MRWRAMGGPGGSSAGAGADGDWGTTEAYAIPVISQETGITYLIGASYIVDPEPWQSDYLLSHYGVYELNLSPPFKGSWAGDQGLAPHDIRKTLSRPAAQDLVSAALADFKVLYETNRERYEQLARYSLYSVIYFKTAPGFPWGERDLRVNISSNGPTFDEALELGIVYDPGWPKDYVLYPWAIGLPRYTGAYFIQGSGVRQDFERVGRDVIWRPDDPSDNMMEPYGVSRFWFLLTRYGTLGTRADMLNVWTDSGSYHTFDATTRPDTQYRQDFGTPAMVASPTGRLNEDPLDYLTEVPTGGRIQYRNGGGRMFSRG